MPNANRGDVYDYDYGTIVAEELSDHRRALIISKNEVNTQLQVAISFPTSENAPAPRHYGNHVEIQNASSWASVRQIKSIDKECLGQYRGTATQEELEKALETLVARLARTQCTPGTINTTSGSKQIAKGTVWYAQFGTPDEDPDSKGVEEDPGTPVFVLDYNDGNGIAIVAEVEFAQNPKSPVRVPITITHENQAQTAASVLIHRIRSIAAHVRLTEKIGEVDQPNINAVNGVLLGALDPEQQWPPPPGTYGRPT